MPKHLQFLNPRHENVHGKAHPLAITRNRLRQVPLRATKHNAATLPDGPRKAPTAVKKLDITSSHSRAPDRKERSKQRQLRPEQARSQTPEVHPPAVCSASPTIMTEPRRAIRIYGGPSQIAVNGARPRIAAKISRLDLAMHQGRKSRLGAVASTLCQLTLERRDRAMIFPRPIRAFYATTNSGDQRACDRVLNHVGLSSRKRTRL